jgi:hypothetical protein
MGGDRQLPGRLPWRDEEIHAAKRLDEAADRLI